MSVIEEVLKEELKRMQRNIQFFSMMLKKIPRGSIYIQNINDARFVYRKRKVNGKVVSEYIGKENSDEAKKAIEEAKKYKQIKKDLIIAKKEYFKLKRACKIYG